jgi:hypothetical protein
MRDKGRLREFGFPRSCFLTSLWFPMPWASRCRFAAGEGPHLAPTIGADGLGAIAGEIDLGVLAPVFETIRRVRAEFAARRHVAGILRSALDGGDLHGRRMWYTGSGAGPVVRVS